MLNSARGMEGLTYGHPGDVWDLSELAFLPGVLQHWKVCPRKNERNILWQPKSQVAEGHTEADDLQQLKAIIDDETLGNQTAQN